MITSNTVAKSGTEFKSIAMLMWLVLLVAAVPTAIWSLMNALTFSKGYTALLLVLVMGGFIFAVVRTAFGYFRYLRMALYMFEVMGVHHRGARLTEEQIKAIKPVVERHMTGECVSEGGLESAVDQVLGLDQ